MSDIALQASVTRTWLGLGDLDINDHDAYSIAPGSLGAGVAWDRTTVSSPYMDDDLTVTRRRGKVLEPMILEVYGDTPVELTERINALVQAFIQDSFALVLNADGRLFSYSCEAADYSLSWNGPRLVARQLQVTFSVPRSPIPLVGVV